MELSGRAFVVGEARRGNASWPLWAERLVVSVVAVLLLVILTRQVGDSFNAPLLTTIESSNWQKLSSLVIVCSRNHLSLTRLFFACFVAIRGHD